MSFRLGDGPYVVQSPLKGVNHHHLRGTLSLAVPVVVERIRLGLSRARARPHATATARAPCCLPTATGGLQRVSGPYAGGEGRRSDWRGDAVVGAPV